MSENYLLKIALVIFCIAPEVFREWQESPEKSWKVFAQLSARALVALLGELALELLKSML